MFYEECWTGGKLCYRTNSEAGWVVKYFGTAEYARKIKDKTPPPIGHVLYIEHDAVDGYYIVHKEKFPKVGPAYTLVNASYRGNFAKLPTLTKSKYHKTIKGVTVDVYDILVAYNITNPADAHAIKKMLMPGRRGGKNAITDRKEAILSLERATQLEEETNETSKKEEPRE